RLALAGGPAPVQEIEAAAPPCTACAELHPLVAAIAAAQARLLRLLGAQAGELAELAALEELLGTGAPAPRRGRVLVVDDSRTVRERHRSILAAAGYDVRTAADGAEALDLL